MSSFSKNGFNFKQPGHFAKYCPSLGIQGNPRTVSQLVNQLYRQDKLKSDLVELQDWEGLSSKERFVLYLRMRS